MSANCVLINSGDGPLTKEERDNHDIVIVSPTGLGNSADYLTARIARPAARTTRWDSVKSLARPSTMYHQNRLTILLMTSLTKTS